MASSKSSCRGTTRIRRENVLDENVWSLTCWALEVDNLKLFDPSSSSNTISFEVRDVLGNGVGPPLSVLFW